MGKARGALTVLVIGMVSPCAFAADKKTEQMKALDNALQTGVLTKEEYEAKKAALLASTPPAASSSETVSTQAKQQKPAAGPITIASNKSKSSISTDLKNRSLR